MKRKRYSRKFQRMAVERMRNCEDVGELAKELGVTQSGSGGARDTCFAFRAPSIHHARYVRWYFRHWPAPQA